MAPCTHTREQLFKLLLDRMEWRHLYDKEMPVNASPNNSVASVAPLLIGVGVANFLEYLPLRYRLMNRYLRWLSVSEEDPRKSVVQVRSRERRGGDINYI